MDQPRDAHSMTSKTTVHLPASCPDPTAPRPSPAPGHEPCLSPHQHPRGQREVFLMGLSMSANPPARHHLAEARELCARSTHRPQPSPSPSGFMQAGDSSLGPSPNPSTPPFWVQHPSTRLTPCLTHHRPLPPRGSLGYHITLGLAGGRPLPHGLKSKSYLFCAVFERPRRLRFDCCLL